ncbi:hypothetical protein O1Q96_29470 [Streptomyces sp. Qhu-G9]|uniref:hypothetical protein n=1 Tax=Streptomyces sp. Qhu-G9 TaxID=3452799 RepID=UPI0022AC7FF7|nr:hypothetical protein [Streptomyces aurantiacus]WAU83460.1 hypothetical protein O1Q96_29470 [Streptomyces aurantiacus]
MTTRSPFDSDRPGISPESAVEAPIPPPPVSAPWHAAPDEATNRATRRADQRYADTVDHQYAEPADETGDRYREPADEADHPYPDPAEEPDHAYPDPTDEADHRYGGPTDEADDPYSDPADHADPAYVDPVDGLVHAAVADRPLDEVVQLIELLEQSPAYARATVDALRAVGTDRSVEDVTRLVALLTRPPRNADSADEAIRAAAEGRPVEDVTRLMALLHRPPLEPHCGEAAVRAAATSRPVEELVELIGRMAQQQDVREERQRAESSTRERAEPAPGAQRAASSKNGPPSGDRLLAAAGPVAIGGAPRTRRGRTARNGDSPAWPRWVAMLALLVCGAAHFPPQRDGASLTSYGFALGAAGLCVLVGLALFRGSRLPVLVLGVVVPAALAVAQLLEGRVQSHGLSRALDLTLAPPWLAGLAAVLAALAALTALIALLASDRPRPRPDVRQLAGSDRAAG